MAMNRMKRYTVAILLLCLTACSLIREKGIEFTIENNSDFPIEDVKFYTRERLTVMEFDKIVVDQSVSDFLSMKDNKRDGNYILEFTRSDGTRELKGYGYYTNGGALDRWVKFEILNNSISVQFSGTGY